MIIVHDIFVCKPGQASKLVKKFKEAMTGQSAFVQFMTDVTGQYNKVVMVSQYESLAAYEENFKKYMQGSDEIKAMQQAMEGYQDMYLTGSREIYQTF